MSPRPFPLSKGPLIAFYGDDFTGSSAAMEAVAFAGIKTVLFLSTPTPERLAAFAGYGAIGIAGTARAQSPVWMRQNLPPIFALLKSTGAPVVHYKVCSTFDSAPGIGSIGCAVECAAPLFPGWVPMIVPDPGMGRWQAFGHLFAQAHGRPYRLDRHPVMARHPTTPMDEADLVQHLAKQTHIPIANVDFVAMKQGRADQKLQDVLEAGAGIVALDMLDAETLEEAGRLVWERGASPLFGFGSQGFEVALVAYWRSVGLLPPAEPLPRVQPVQQVACVSGSVSPVTAAQIAFARAKGFVMLPLDTAKAVSQRDWDSEVGRAADAACAAIGQGRSVLIHSAEGPDDPSVAAFRAALAASGAEDVAVNERIGEGLGDILDQIVSRTGLPRVVISGGDTSGRAASRLGIDALTAIAPLASGSPLCRAHAARKDRDGLEITLKGGQVGQPDFFVLAREGGS